tara:strand:- start:4309 stop:6045 length:1737 start_codon:yes stop_codon:yes gene_type:complete
MSEWIAGIALGHNAGVCLLKDGEIVFSVEEERLSKFKHDGGPLLSMMKILDYTDKLDYLVISHLIANPEDIKEYTVLEYTREPLYQGFARRLGLIEQSRLVDEESPQVINMIDNHHQCHSAIAFYNSGFQTAASVIVDSNGSSNRLTDDGVIYYETESIFDCSYTKGIKTIYKKVHCTKGKSYLLLKNYNPDLNETFDLEADEGPGIGKVWDAVTDYCGFHVNECGKTMGLSAYGAPNPNLPDLFQNDTANKDLIKAFYPYRSELNTNKYNILDVLESADQDMAFKVQEETQEQVLKLIIKASEMSNNKNVVLSGGYALNCVSNYYYLDKLKEHDINLYVEPNSSDAGTATGAALLYHYRKGDINKRERIESLYLGPEQEYTGYDVFQIIDSYNGQVNDASYKEIAELIKEGNIVAIFQGRSENGPRALGNRSILFNPTIKNGKDIVNKVKKREWFRPFAASVMKEYAHDWFDMKGLKESPHMMYAVDVKEDKKNLIPAVLHVDDTCRIQTVNKNVNEHYYNLIEEFYKLTGIPLLFNTSLNLAGDPLAETLDDVMKILTDSEMEYCYMPEHATLIKL